LKINILLGFVTLSIVLILFNIGSIKSHGSNTTAVNGSNTTSVNLDDASLKKLAAEYINWDTSIPDEKMPTQQSSGNQCVMKSGSVNFLVDPFSRGTINQICDINSGSSLLFPFYIGFCDNGGSGNYGQQSFQKILECALDSDKGIVTMEGWLDGNKIIDTKVDNKDFHKPKLVYDKFPENKYYKVIKSDNFFNLTVTNKTRLIDSYEKPEDFQSSPAIYKAAGHCFCGLIPNLSQGAHELRYKTTMEGTGGVAKGQGWDQETDITYKLNVK
jgi:hypothetical protein